MSDLEKARDLLGEAERDLRPLRGMTDTEVFDDEIAGFHAQQVAQKPLKVWLIQLGEAYPSTHDVDYLLRSIERRDPNVDRFEDFADYSPNAVQFRYASFNPDMMPIYREEAVHRLERTMARGRATSA